MAQNTKHLGKWRQEGTELRARLGYIIRLCFNNNAEEEELDGSEECLTNLWYMPIPRSMPQVSLDSFQNSGLVWNVLSTPALKTYQASAVANVGKTICLLCCSAPFGSCFLCFIWTCTEFLLLASNNSFLLFSCPSESSSFQAGNADLDVLIVMTSLWSIENFMCKHTQLYDNSLYMAITDNTVRKLTDAKHFTLIKARDTDVASIVPVDDQKQN